MERQCKRSWLKKIREAFRLALVLSLLCGTVGQAFPDGRPASGREGQNVGPAQTMREAKSKLQQGLNTWNPVLLEEARNLFIRCLMQSDKGNAVFLYYVGLVDYRLAIFSFSGQDTAAAERWTTEGEQYLEKAMIADPAFAEAFALYGYLLGMELALHPEKAMELGMKSFGSFDQALSIDPSNPRIHLLKGVYLLYVPEAYGGGPDSALESLLKAVGFFEKERVEDPMKPDWGKDEAYTYLGIIYKRKGDPAKAREMLVKALSLNPESGQAKTELAALDRKMPGENSLT